MGDFYTIYETDMTDDECREYIMFKQLGMIRTIRNCVVFFTVIAVIALVLSLFSIFSMG